MSDPLPRTISRPLQFQNGCAIGISNRWQQGQYCTLLQRYGDYLGVDIDEDSVAEARELFPTAEFAACDILDEGRLKALLPDGADAIISINVLEHIEDDARAVANLIDALKPGKAQDQAFGSVNDSRER